VCVPGESGMHSRYQSGTAGDSLQQLTQNVAFACRELSAADGQMPWFTVV